MDWLSRLKKVVSQEATGSISPATAEKEHILSEGEQETLEERSAIIEHEGGLSRDQADKYAWCREVCMLTKGQRELCERVNPCPKNSDHKNHELSIEFFAGRGIQ